MNSFYDIEENLKEIRFNIAEAVSKYRKPDDNVRLMAVTKTVPFEYVNHAVSLGIDLWVKIRFRSTNPKWIITTNLLKFSL